MMLSLAEQIVLIALAALGVMLTRFLPFLLFSPNRPTPPLIRYLAKCLAPAVLAFLWSIASAVLSLAARMACRCCLQPPSPPPFRHSRAR